MFTLYRTVKWSVAESVPDRASSVHTRNAAFEAVSAPEQYWSAPLLEVERSVSDKQRGKTRHWLERYHFVVSTLALDLKINFDQPIRLMEFQ